MTDFNRLIRYLAYTLELLVLFMVQETPGLLPYVLGGRPLLLLPAVLTIALFEEDVPSMVFGIAAGLLLDYGLSGVMGFHALLLVILCFLVNLMVKAYLQVNLVTAILTGVWTTAVILAAQWLFLFYLPGYSMPTYALTHHYVPVFFYTLLFFPLVYVLNKGLYQALQKQKDR